MLVDGARAHVEYHADLAIGFAIGYPEKHFGLASCQ